MVRKSIGPFRNLVGRRAGVVIGSLVLTWATPFLPLRGQDVAKETSPASGESTESLSLHIFHLQHLPSDRALETYRTFSKQLVKEKPLIVVPSGPRTLLVQSTDRQFQEFKALIAQIDVAPQGEQYPSKLSVFALANADASKTVEMMTRMFPNLSWGVDARTNSLIAAGGTQQVESAEQLLMRIDQPIKEAAPAHANHRLRVVWFTEDANRQASSALDSRWAPMIEELQRHGIERPRLSGSVSVVVQANKKAFRVRGSAADGQLGVQGTIEQLTPDEFELMIEVQAGNVHDNDNRRVPISISTEVTAKIGNVVVLGTADNSDGDTSRRAVFVTIVEQ